MCPRADRAEHRDRVVGRHDERVRDERGQLLARQSAEQCVHVDQLLVANRCRLGKLGLANEMNDNYKT